MAKTSLPSLPDIPKDVTPAMRQLLSSMREVLQVQAGQGRGNELDRAVTFRDLQDSTTGAKASSAAIRAVLSDYASSQVWSTVVERPTAPTGVSVTAYIGGVFVSWDAPRYSGHVMTEVFFQRTEMDENNEPKDPPLINTETMLNGTSASTNYANAVETGYGYYVWVRHVNARGVVGALSKPLGDFIFVPHRPAELIAQLQGQVSEDVFTQELLEKIGYINTAKTLILDLSDTVKALQNADTDADSAVSQLGTTLAQVQATIASVNSGLTESINAVSSNLNTAKADLTQAVNTVQHTSVEQVQALEAAYKAADTTTNSNLSTLTQTVSNNYSALSQSIANLEAAYKAADTTTNSNLTNLTQTVSNNYSALSQSIANLDAAYKASDTTTNSNLTTLTQTVSSNYSALSQSIANLDAAYKAADTTTNSKLTTLTQTVSSNYSALSQSIANLDAAYKAADTTTNSNLTTLTQTVSNNYSALSQSIVNLDAAYKAADSTTNSTLSNLSKTVSDNESSSADSLERLRSDMAFALESVASSIEILNRSFSDSTSTTAERYMSLEAGYEAADAQTNSALSQLAKTVSDSDSALSQLITSLTSTVTDNYTALNAAITSEQSTRASADTALSSSISSVSAVANAKNKTFLQTTAPTSGMITGDLWFDTDDNNKTYRYSGSAWVLAADARIASNAAAITAEQTARADADTALSNSISTVSAVANAKNKTYYQTAAPTTGMTAGDLWFDMDNNNTPYRYSGTAWVTTADPRTAANAAAITTEQTARANGDSANATAINTLSATVDGHTASIQTNASAIATTNSTYSAQWSTKTTVAGLTGGFGIYNDGKNTRFTVAANKFAIVDPAGDGSQKVPFVVSGGAVYLDTAYMNQAWIESVAAGQITAAKINSLNLNAINITGGTLSLGGGNNMSFQEGGAAGFGKGGPYGGWGYGWNTIIYADGGIFTNRLYASAGTFSGTVNANAGTFNNVTISESCDVRGTVYADKLVGDVTATKAIAKGTTYTVLSSPKARTLILQFELTLNASSPVASGMSILVNGATVSSDTIASSSHIREFYFYTYTIAANTSITFRINVVNTNYTQISGLAIVTPVASGTFA